MSTITSLSPYTSLIGFVLGFPTAVGAYYQSWKTRQESRLARQGLIFSDNCLEFVLDDGTSVNVIPLETLHSLPKPGDIVLLPGMEDGLDSTLHPELPHGAYRVNRIEHIYAPVQGRWAHSGQARLAKAVAHVDRLGSSSEVEQSRAAEEVNEV